MAFNMAFQSLHRLSTLKSENLCAVIVKSSDDKTTTDALEDLYKAQIQDLMEKEANRIVAENNDPEETSRLCSLSLVELYESNDPDLVPALMARLGPVRAALEGHGGGIVLSSAEVEVTNAGNRALSLIIDLDGACVSCGAAPGTLKGIQDDLLIDEQVLSVKFTSSMLEWFDDIQRDFVLEHGGVSFV